MGLLIELIYGKIVLTFTFLDFVHFSQFTLLLSILLEMTILAKKGISMTAVEVPDIVIEDKSVNPMTDMLFSPYNNVLIGSDIWLRPIFPEDYEDIIPMHTGPSSMKYFGTGHVYSEDEVREEKDILLDIL